MTRHSRRQVLKGLPIGGLGLLMGALGFGANPMHAQEPESTPPVDVSVPQARVKNPMPPIVIDLPSTKVAQTYRLFLSLPENYGHSTQTYPVIYVLDGNALFVPACTSTELLQIPGDLLDMIIVGIGYPEATYMDTLGLRGRDMTFDTLSPDEITWSGYPFEETGGGFQFLDVVQSELVPFVEQKYRIDGTKRGLLGWSLAGDAVLYSMLSQPGLFQRIASVSPSFESSKGGVLDMEMQYSRGHSVLPTKLFIAHEEPPLTLGLFTRALQSRNYEGFSLSLSLYEKEDHFSMVPRAITEALRTLFP